MMTVPAISEKLGGSPQQLETSTCLVDSSKTARISCAKSRTSSISLWELLQTDDFTFTPIKPNSSSPVPSTPTHTTTTTKKTNSNPKCKFAMTFSEGGPADPMTPPPSVPSTPPDFSTAARLSTFSNDSISSLSSPSIMTPLSSSISSSSTSSSSPVFSSSTSSTSHTTNSTLDELLFMDSTDNWQSDAVVPDLDFDLCGGGFSLEIDDELWDSMLLEDKPLLLDAPAPCSIDITVVSPACPLTPPPTSSTTTVKPNSTCNNKRKLMFDEVSALMNRADSDDEEDKLSPQQLPRKIATARSEKRIKTSKSGPVAKVVDFNLTAFFDRVAIDCGKPGINTVTNGTTTVTTIIGLTKESTSCGTLSPCRRRTTPFPKCSPVSYSPSTTVTKKSSSSASKTTSKRKTTYKKAL